MVATATAWILIALAVAAALVLTAAAARAQGRRMERRMVAELGRRWDQPAQRAPANVPKPAASAGAEAPAGVGAEPPRGDEDLQITLEELLGQRDALLEEFQAVQAQISVLKKRVNKNRPVAAVADEDEDEDVIQLHDVLPEEWAERRRR